jgi:DNA-binding HxlR family transcriptional regulator
MSSSVRDDRLRELVAAHLVERPDDGGGYRLTELGAALGKALEPLDAWAQAWARALPAGGKQTEGAGVGEGM